jgi:hypothetical protein
MVEESTFNRFVCFGASLVMVCASANEKLRMKSKMEKRYNIASKVAVL